MNRLNITLVSDNVLSNILPLKGKGKIKFNTLTEKSKSN